MDKKSLAERYLIHKNQVSPKEALRSLQYSGELQKARLEKHGLRHEVSFEYRDQVLKNAVRRWEDEYYEEEMFAHNVELTDTFYSGKKQICYRKKPLIFYTTVVDLNGPCVGEDDVYCCPNCGAPGKIKVLLEKCPYCGTHFKIVELYPKVENSWSVYDHGMTNEEMNKGTKKYIISGMLIAMLLSVIGSLSRELSVESVLLTVFTTVFSGGIGAFFGYMIWAMQKLGRLFVEAGKSLPLLAGTGSARKFEKVMSGYSGAYTYEHFTSTVVSLLKILIYSDTDTVLPFYSGKANTLFEDVIDCSYRGSMALKSIDVHNSVCTAKVKVFMENLCYDGKKVRERRNTVLLTVRKDLRGEPIRPFSILAINCRSCGGSFDALKNRNCPYCGREYELQDLDWVITDISQG